MICFSLAIIVIVALSMDVLGIDPTLNEASWCWIDTRVPNVFVWQMATGKFWEIIAYVTTVILYTIIKCFLIKKVILFCRRHYKIKFDIDPGYIFRLLLQFHSRKPNTMYRMSENQSNITVRDAIHRVWCCCFLFPLCVIRNVEKKDCNVP